MAKRGPKPKTALSGIADLRVIGHPYLKLSLPDPDVDSDKVRAYEQAVSYALWIRRQHHNKQGWWKYPHDPLKCFFCRSLQTSHS